MTVIIGVDPGKVTGVAHLVLRGWRFQSWELPRVDVIPHVRGLIQRTPPTRRTVLVVERFVIGQRTVRSSRQPDAMELCGALRELAAEYDTVDFAFQGAADAKRAGRREVLQRLGWWRRTRDMHASDAAAHVVLALLRVDPARLLDHIEFDTVDT